MPSIRLHISNNHAPPFQSFSLLLVRLPCQSFQIIGGSYLPYTRSRFHWRSRQDLFAFLWADRPVKHNFGRYKSIWNFVGGHTRKIYCLTWVYLDFKLISTHLSRLNFCPVIVTGLSHFQVTVLWNPSVEPVRRLWIEGYDREEIKELQRRDPEFGIIYSPGGRAGCGISQGGYKLSQNGVTSVRGPALLGGGDAVVDLKVYMGILYQVGDDPWRLKLRLVFPPAIT